MLNPLHMELYRNLWSDWSIISFGPHALANARPTNHFKTLSNRRIKNMHCSTCTQIHNLRSDTMAKS